MKFDLCVTTMFQNEADIMAEWIDFHVLQGVQHFYLYDHFSTDESRAIASAFGPGLVTIVDLTVEDPATARKWMIRDVKTRSTETTTWLAIIDVDEFLFCPDADRNVLRVLEDVDRKHGNVGAVVAPWVCFGLPCDTLREETRVLATKTCVTEYCQRRGLLTFGANQHIKSIVKTDKWTTERVDDPHGFHYAAPFRAVDTAGRIVKGPYHPDFPSVPLDELRINHYMMRSIKHYTHEKIKRYAYNSQAGPFANVLRRDAATMEVLAKVHDDTAWRVFNAKRLQIPAVCDAV